MPSLTWKWESIQGLPVWIEMNVAKSRKLLLRTRMRKMEKILGKRIGNWRGRRNVKSKQLKRKLADGQTEIPTTTKMLTIIRITMTRIQVLLPPTLFPFVLLAPALFPLVFLPPGASFLGLSSPDAPFLGFLTLGAPSLVFPAFGALLLGPSTSYTTSF